VVVEERERKKKKKGAAVFCHLNFGTDIENSNDRTRSINLNIMS
jgi:hypothetical protein